MKRYIFVVLGCAIFFTCTALAGEKVHWGYEVDNGPSHWGELNPDWVLCKEGRHQSPIDLTGAKQEKLEQMKLNIPPANLRIVHHKDPLEVLDNGHTIQINHDKGGILKIGNNIYKLQQGHFHSPSEHTVNGRHYPMEMHLVHISKDKKVAVIGVFMEEGRHNATIDIIWSNMPKETGQEVHLENVQFTFLDLLPKSQETYRYQGSFTTPPCSEDIRWFLFVEPIELSSKQIKAFQKIFYGNNRPPQPLNDRTLVYDVVTKTKK